MLLLHTRMFALGYLQCTYMIAFFNTDPLGSPTCQANEFFELPSQRKLQIDTQNFNIGSNTTTFEFFSSQNCRNFQFHLLIYDMIGANPRDNIALECCNGSFPSAELVSSDEGVSYFRLVSFTNNTSCANNRMFFYTFNGKIAVLFICTLTIFVGGGRKQLISEKIITYTI